MRNVSTMPSSSRARWGCAARTSSGWVISRSVQPTSSSTVAAQHLGERLVGVDDPAVVEPDERHPRGRRVERLLEAAPGLVEGPGLLLALGHVTESHDESPSSGSATTWCVAGRTTPRPPRRRVAPRRAASIWIGSTDSPANARSISHAAGDPCSLAIGVVEQIAVDERRDGADRTAGQRGGVGRRGPTHAVVERARPPRAGRRAGGAARPRRRSSRSIVRLRCSSQSTAGARSRC